MVPASPVLPVSDASGSCKGSTRRSVAQWPSLCSRLLAVPRMPIFTFVVISTRDVTTVSMTSLHYTAVRRMPSRREPRRAREKRLDGFDYMSGDVTQPLQKACEQA